MMNMRRFSFIFKTLAAKLIEEVAVWLILGLVVLFAAFPKIWELIPLMERFATIPWLLFMYTYSVCSMYENTHKLKKHNRVLVKSNYLYALWWGLVPLAIHYIHLPYSINPQLLENQFWATIHEINLAYQDFHLNYAPDKAGIIHKYVPWAGLAIALYGATKAASARIRLNGYWAIDVYSYKDKHDLIVDGPYKKIRHPIYIGQIYLAFGTLFITQKLEFFVFFLLVVYLNIRRADTEEKELIKLFPSHYEKYMSNSYKMINGIY